MNRSAHHPLARARAIWLGRNEPENARAFAELYWRALLGTAIIVLIIAAVYAAVFFSSVLSQVGTLAPRSASHGTSALNEQQLQSTLQGLSGRQAAFQSLQSGGGLHVSDPSAGD